MQRRDFDAGPHLESAVVAERVQAVTCRENARGWLQKSGTIHGDARIPRGDLVGTGPFERCARCLHGGSNFLDVGAEGHLTGLMEEGAADPRFEPDPELSGPHRHLDVEAVGVSQPEDPGVALGTGTLMAQLIPSF